jgi:predicted ATP-grasp superfamily ATP-dependent carboligase
VVTTQPFDIAHRSRHVSDFAAVRDLHARPEALVELLERKAPDWRGRVLLPTNDEALDALAAHHDRLASLYRIAFAPEAVPYLLDKARMAEAARAAGADVPDCYGPADQATASRADLSFPVLVKPRTAHRFAARFGVKLFVARDRAELRECVARVDGIAADVHELVPGDDGRIYAHATYVDASGEPHGGVTIRKLRQSPAFFGVARVAEIPERAPEIHELTVELLRRIGHRGPAAAEFKLDARTGRLRFIEVNGRAVVYNALLRKGGLDLAGLAWAEHSGEGAAPARANGWGGVWINLHADVLHAALRRRDQRLGLREFLAPYRRPKIEAVWSAADPAPFMSQWAWTARRAMRRA